jgi:hypothetical protein
MRNEEVSGADIISDDDVRSWYLDLVSTPGGLGLEAVLRWDANIFFSRYEFLNYNLHCPELSGS